MIEKEDMSSRKISSGKSTSDGMFENLTFYRSHSEIS